MRIVVNKEEYYSLMKENFETIKYNLGIKGLTFTDFMGAGEKSKVKNILIKGLGVCEIELTEKL